MRVVRFLQAEKNAYGIFNSDGIVELDFNPFQADSAEALAAAAQKPADVDPKKVELLTPCTPSKYVGVGLNYRAVAERLGRAIPENPIPFLKPASSVIGPNQPIILPEDSTRVIFEGELAVVIGKVASNVPVEKAQDYIFGYTITNDVSDVTTIGKGRDNLTVVKARDSFGPIGPWIETDYDPQQQPIVTKIGDTVHQDGLTSDMIFAVPELVSYLSSLMTLMPGDVIATGTPDGATAMREGDRVDISIDGLGTLSNPVLRETQISAFKTRKIA